MEISDVLIFISFVIAVSLDETTISIETELRLQKRRQMECIEETRVDPGLVFSIRQDRWKRHPNPLLKEWALCVLMKAGLMTREGVYRIDVALSRVPPYEAESDEYVITECLSPKAIPAVDIAYNFVRCYYKAKGNSLVSAI